MSLQINYGYAIAAVQTTRFFSFIHRLFLQSVNTLKKIATQNVPVSYGTYSKQALSSNYVHTAENANAVMQLHLPPD